MSANAALHDQMILPSQQVLYNYWRSKCYDGRLPARSDIDPSHIKDHLPTISITSVCNKTATQRYQCRLAGTGFWDLYEEEIQGRYIDELPLGDRREYWNRVLTQVATRGKPTAGVTRPGTPFGSHLAQFWIRLPLSENGRDVNLILGYDQLIKMSDLPKAKAEPARLYA